MAIVFFPEKYFKYVIGHTFGAVDYCAARPLLMNSDRTYILTH